MFCGILNQTHVGNSHSTFGQLFWFSGKCVFDEKMPSVTSKTHLGRVYFLEKWVINPTFRIPYWASWDSLFPGNASNANVTTALLLQPARYNDQFTGGEYFSRVYHDEF